MFSVCNVESNTPSTACCVDYGHSPTVTLLRQLQVKLVVIGNIIKPNGFHFDLTSDSCPGHEDDTQLTKTLITIIKSTNVLALLKLYIATGVVFIS